MMMKNVIQQLHPWMGPYKVGVGTQMIFDKPRNQFYWELLKQCKDKTCVDVGFGTGILTLIALHHGANHVIAYESDPSTFELGKYIINELGFSDSVTFFNEEYKSTTHEDRHVDLIFHEIIGRNIWDENIKRVFQGAVTKIIPSAMTCNIRLFPGSVNPKRLPKNDSTGCQWLDETYLKVLKDLWRESDTVTYDGHEYGNFRGGKIIGSYTYDINNIVPDLIEIDIEVEKGIVFMDYFVDGFLLKSGHWPEDKRIRVNKKHTKFIQNTIDGNWWLE